LALDEQVPPPAGMWWSVVGPNAYLYSFDGAEIEFILSRPTWEWVIDFDRGRAVQPSLLTMERVR
jgi:hypothetical protein